jgi:hypothetical protein
MRTTIFFTCFISLISCKSQPGFGQKLLKLEKEIALPGVKGRIDHIDIDVSNQVAYVAALGNNTVEIVDLEKGAVVHTINGLSEPQGVAYIPKHHELFVANGGTGECVFYNAVTYEKTGSIKFDGDADDVRYDELSDRIYVGYGSGGIGIISGTTHKLIANIKLPAHPESFQLDTKEGKLWVNLPGAGSIGVVDIHKANW